MWSPIIILASEKVGSCIIVRKLHVLAVAILPGDTRQCTGSHQMCEQWQYCQGTPDSAQAVTRCVSSGNTARDTRQCTGSHQMCEQWQYCQGTPDSAQAVTRCVSSGNTARDTRQCTGSHQMCEQWQYCQGTPDSAQAVTRCVSSGNTARGHQTVHRQSPDV